MNGLVDGPGGWLLAPEGAAVFPAEATAVVADVHLGYEWARGAGGDCVPPHSLGETIGLIDRLRSRVGFRKLVVAGDLVESRRFCRRTSADVARLSAWLGERGIDLVVVAGNHDPPRRPPLPRSVEVGGWTVVHGHRRDDLDHPRAVCGHHHPALRASGLSAPCFLVGPSSIVLPAFSRNAAGVGLGSLDPALTGPDRSGHAPRCLATSGGELLDFGPVPDLLRALLEGASA